MDSTTAVKATQALTLYTAPISPEDGVDFLAQDSVYHPDAIQQTVNLVNGQEYDLNFYWATGQQTTFSGDTYDEWQAPRRLGAHHDQPDLQSEPRLNGLGGLRL